MKKLKLFFMSLALLFVVYVLYKLVGPWVFAFIVALGLLTRFK